MRNRQADLLVTIIAVLASGCAGRDAAQDPVLKTARTHPMQYYVSLPRGWSPARRWPIVVTIDGANKEWLLNARTFATARGDRPFIIVTPLVMTNTGKVRREAYAYSEAVWGQIDQVGPAVFDDTGVHAVVAEVRLQYSGQQKFFITGFSGGGHLAWLMVFRHPEELAGAALAAGNYIGRGIEGFSDAPERVNLPVKGFQGAWDRHKPAMDLSWEKAQRDAEAHGYRNVSRLVVPHAVHSMFAPEVLRFFNSILNERQVG
jgi:dienelactone hydrolase